MLLDIAMLLLGVILTAGTFIFVSAEFSLVALDQAVVESRAAAGDARGGKPLRTSRLNFRARRLASP